VSEFLGDTLNVWDIDRALLYCIWKTTFAYRWIHYGINEFLWVFIAHQIIFYVPNIHVEILLTLNLAP
jgi:hypothetical protein